MDANKQTKHSAYTKKIHKDQKLAPVITLVLYYGSNWNGPKSLRDMMDLTDKEHLLPYITDYPMNLIELGADKELYKKFHSDFRLVVQYLSVRDDKEALDTFMQDTTTNIRHVEEFLDVMNAMEQNDGYEQIKDSVLEKSKKESTTMYSITEEYINRGMAQGMTQGIERFASLTAHLLSENRQADLLRATTDEEYRTQLFEEYGI